MKNRRYRHRSLPGLLALALTIAIVPGALVVQAAAPAHAVDNGLALTPPMGWNDWNALNCDGLNEQVVEQTADFLVSSGLKDAGYQYVNLDDCWMPVDWSAPTSKSLRDPVTGQLMVDRHKFPNGIKAVADYVHAKGLKFGIYESAGEFTCQHGAGSLHYESLDAATFAGWGVDYLKYDDCPGGQTGSYPDRYRPMADALKATGRSIVYSICTPVNGQPWTWASSMGNLWRTADDIKPTFASLVASYETNVELARYAKPGAWNDPDMLEVGNAGLSPVESRSEFSLWSEMAAPLIAGTDLRTASADTLSIYGNRDVIAVDQDPLGRQGVRIASVGGLDVLAKPLANGDVSVVLFNKTDTSATISTSAGAVGAKAARSYLLDDLWSHRTTRTSGAITTSVPAHGTVMYRVSGSSAPSEDVRLAIVGSDGALWSQSGDYVGGHFDPTWARVDGTALTKVTSVTSGTTVHVYGIAQGLVYGEDLDTTTGTWSTWGEIPGHASGVADLTVAMVNNTAHLEIVGGDGAMWSQDGDYNAGHFNPSWTRVNGTGLNRLTSVAAGTLVHVYAIAMGRIYGEDLDTTTGTWGSWGEIPGGVRGAVDLTAAVTG